jgi:hypothetical protein
MRNENLLALDAAAVTYDQEVPNGYKSRARPTPRCIPPESY